jgi:type IV pilus assembly protein PilC
MFFSPRVPTKLLAGLCRRLSLALEAGIDARTVWTREAERAQNRHLRHHLNTISEAIRRGDSFADALAETGDFFPQLVREMIVMGEQTGHLDAVLAQLADHYDNQLAMRRNFLAAIAWPVIQLCLAILIVGFLIWVTGFIREMNHDTKLDILGFGLVGDRGLVLYAMIVAGVGIAIFFVVQAIRRGLVWTQPIQRFLLRIPGLGKPLQTMALARLAWSLHITMSSGMEIRRAIQLSLRSTQNAFYTDQIRLIDVEIASGHSLHEAFSYAGGYPVEFLDTLAVGEQTGMAAESMATLARQYQDRARAAMTVITLLAGWLVWAAIAGLIIMIIFRVFSFYLNTINSVM